MSKNDITLQYINEDDRAYGLAGMAISVAALDATDRIVCMSLDTDGPMVTFSHEYYYCGSPSISPKATWNNLMENFHITSAMVLANVMARSLVRMHSEVPEDVMHDLYEEIAREGRETCALDDDEVLSVFNRTHTLMRRIFYNPRIYPAIDEFVRIVSRRRELSGLEIREELHLLHLL